VGRNDALISVDDAEKFGSGIPGVQVKLYEHEGELYVLAKSAGRQGKEKAIRRKPLARLLRKLRGMRRSLPERDQLLLRIGAAKKEASRAFGFVTLRVPKADEEVTRQTFTLPSTNRNSIRRNSVTATICCARI